MSDKLLMKLVNRASLYAADRGSVYATLAGEQ